MTTREDPQPGWIGLVPMPGAVGKIIKFGQWLAADGWTKYQHAFVVAGETDGLPGTRVVEAMPHGALNSSLSRYDAEEIVWLRCPPQYGGAVASEALRFVGVGYSAADYGALSLHRFHIPAPHLESFIKDRKTMICSQLADAAAGIGGWHIFDDERWPGYVTPNDLGKAARLQLPGQYVERVKVSR